jgi:hypothetical protein
VWFAEPFLTSVREANSKVCSSRVNWLNCRQKLRQGNFVILKYSGKSARYPSALGVVPEQAEGRMNIVSYVERLP